MFNIRGSCNRLTNLTKDLESKHIKCEHCAYEWDSKPKRPDPRFITCPNCRGNVELRGSKLD